MAVLLSPTEWKAVRDAVLELSAYAIQIGGGMLADDACKHREEVYALQKTILDVVERVVDDE